MSLTIEQLETVKKAGHAIAKAAERNLSLFYSVERARNLHELLDALSQVAHRMGGLKSGDFQGNEGWQYVSLNSVSQLVELLHEIGEDRQTLNDVRNTLTIFAAVEHAKGSRRTSSGGGSDAQ